MFVFSGPPQVVGFYSKTGVRRKHATISCTRVLKVAKSCFWNGDMMLTCILQKSDHHRDMDSGPCKHRNALYVCLHTHSFLAFSSLWTGCDYMWRRNLLSGSRWDHLSAAVSRVAPISENVQGAGVCHTEAWILLGVLPSTLRLLCCCLIKPHILEQSKAHLCNIIQILKCVRNNLHLFTCWLCCSLCVLTERSTDK